MKKIGLLFILIVFFSVGCVTKISEWELSKNEDNLTDEENLVGQAQLLKNIRNDTKFYKTTCFDSDGGSNYTNAGYVTLFNSRNVTINKSDFCWNDKKRLQEYVCENGKYKGDHTFDCSSLGSNYGCDSNQCSSLSLRQASVLELPFPRNFHCFFIENKNNSECTIFYREECSPYGICDKRLVCPKYYNPVCGADGKFYPSQCWAEELGIVVKSRGICPALQKFITDMWFTRDTFGNSLIVPSPNVEFEYSGSGIDGFKTGTWFRSTLWETPTRAEQLDFNIYIPADVEANLSITKDIFTPLVPVVGSRPKLLLAFVMFEDIYPEQVLLDWTNSYDNLFNDYITKKQHVPNPIQYDIIPVVIPPPEGVETISQNHFFYSPEEIGSVLNTARQKLSTNEEFEIFAIVHVEINGFGGYFNTFGSQQFIAAPLGPPAPYSTTDVKQGIDSLAAFQAMLNILSHESLHAFGLPGDHALMGYGTVYLDTGGQNVDLITGRKRSEVNACDFLGISPDYYAVDLPHLLRISLGQEPNSLFKEQSVTGDCLVGLHNNEYLKEYDDDGDYEIMYKNNLIGIELQRSLGWVDIDGDNITEVIDQNAYGNWKNNSNSSRGSFSTTAYKSVFEPLGEITISGCKFERVLVEDVPGIQFMEGLVPLQCAEFNKDIVNIYRGFRYKWEIVHKNYGIILIPRVG
ncbi:TPA: hypothetical protein HA241_00825 [Candidatus Woesearchaeota archaeon]|nr:hypothetical protein [Candidatus Woesearchaeota archaeon]